MFNRDQNFRGNSFMRNYEVLNSTVVNPRFENPNVNTVTSQSQEVF